MPDAYGAPSPYARTPFMPPWLKGTLIVGGGLAAGALVSRTAMAAMRPEVLPTPGPTPTPSTEPVQLVVERGTDTMGNMTARFASSDPRFVPGQRVEEAFIRSPLPVRVLVSVPEAMEAVGATPGEGSRLLAGVPEQSKDFIFSLDQYVGDSPVAPADPEVYSAVVTVKFHVPFSGITLQIPLFIYAVSG